MADIAALFEDVLFPVEITDKRNGKPIGLTIHLSAFENDDSSNAWFRARWLIEAQRSDGKSVDPDVFAELITKADVRRCIAAVKKWDWHGNSFADLGKDPECTLENKIKVFSHPATGFIIEQLLVVGNNAENFPQKPETN